MELKKGDLVFVDAPDKPVGTELQDERPAIVISPVEMSIHAKRIVVVPLTSQNTDKIYPFECLIESSKKRSKAKCDQVVTISIQRVKKKFGKITKDEMKRLDKAIKFLFQLE